MILFAKYTRENFSRVSYLVTFNRIGAKAKNLFNLVTFPTPCLIGRASKISFTGANKIDQ